MSVGLALPPASNPIIDHADDAPAHPIATASRVLGIQSCVPCHQQNRGEGDGFSAVNLWQAEDPHARAFAVLSDPAAERMTKLLKLKPPTQEPLCIGCHVQPEARSWPANDHRLDEGVNCEACHGPAEKWLDAHYRKDWKTMEEVTKVKLGWHDTRGYFNRAQSCVSCHVGKDDLDVNHDFIAAGHPALFFELTSALRRMPKHWPKEKPQESAIHAAYRLWRIGQDATCAAAPDLTAARAKDLKRSWPELAEYDCLACHRNFLAGGSARRSRSMRAEAPWQPWFGFWKEFGMVFDEPAAWSALSAKMALSKSPSRAVAGDANRAAAIFRAAAQQEAQIAYSVRVPNGTVMALNPRPNDWLRPASALQRWEALTTFKQAYIEAGREKDFPDVDWRRLESFLPNRRN